MSNYDAEIRISTKVDTSQMQKLQIQIDKATNKVETLSAKYDELKNKKVSTDAFSTLENNLKSVKTELEKLIAEEKRLADAGLAIGAPWDNVIAKEAEAQLKIESIQAEMQKLIESGKAFTIGGNREEISKTSNELSMAQAELRALITKQDELTSSQRKTAFSLDDVADGFRKIKEVSKKVFGTLTPKVHKTSGALSTLASRFKGIALSLLIFNWVTRGFNAMVSGMKEGFKNLIKYSDTYEQSVADLKNANSQLQNSFAAAFAPLVQMVIPHLITLINYVTKAMNTLAQFVAVLSGKAVWLKATEVQGDYADSLNGTASAAKKAMGALASFDSLEVLNKKEESGGGGSAGGGFEEIPIEPNAMVNLAKRLKELIAADDWYGVGALIGEKINGLLENINWDYIQSKAGEIARNIANFLNGGLETINWNLVGYTLAQGLNTGFIFLNTFATTFHWESLGKAIYDSINGFFSTFDFKLAAETISNISHGLFTTIQTAIEGTDWEQIGVQVATFLKEIRWNELFKDVGTTVMDAFVASIKFAGGVLLGDTDLYKYFETGVAEITASINAMRGDFSTGNSTADGMALSEIENALDIYNEMYDIKKKNNELSLTDIENGKKIEELMSKEGEILNLNLTDLQKYTDELVLTSKEQEEFFETMKKAFDFNEIGENSKKGFVNGISGVEEETKGCFSLLLDLVKGILGVHSPSTVFEEIGMFLIQGLILGLQNTWAQLIEWWNSSIGLWIEESVSPWFSSETWIELAQGIVDGISEKWEELSEWWSTNIVAWWDTNVAPWFTVEQWKTLGDNMKKGIYNGFCGIVSNVVGVMNGIIAACENMINAIISKINEFINGANMLAKAANIDINFGTLSPIQFGRVEMPKIPALANGAVLRGGNPMLAILNDQPAGQTNIEAPLSTIEKALENVYNRVGNTNAVPANYFLQVNGQTFGELVVEDFISVLNRKGYNIDVLLNN